MSNRRLVILLVLIVALGVAFVLNAGRLSAFLMRLHGVH